MNLEVQQTTETNLSDLLPAVIARKNEGCRLMAITATMAGNRYELCYAFDKDYRVRVHRVTIPKGETLPTITGMYPSAFVYENELRDIFGITVTGNRVSARDNRPRIRVTYPFELTTPPGDMLCRNR